MTARNTGVARALARQRGVARAMSETAKAKHYDGDGADKIIDLKVSKSEE